MKTKVLNFIFKLNPKLMLFGHSSAITCLALSTSNHQDTWIVSSSDNGCVRDINNFQIEFFTFNIEGLQIFE